MESTYSVRGNAVRTAVRVVRGKCAGKRGTIAGTLEHNPGITRVIVLFNGGGHAIIEIVNLELDTQTELPL